MTSAVAEFPLAIAAEHLVELGTKLVKGMTYVQLGRPIPQGYTIRIFLED